MNRDTDKDTNDAEGHKIHGAVDEASTDSDTEGHSARYGGMTEADDDDAEGHHFSRG